MYNSSEHNIQSIGSKPLEYAITRSNLDDTVSDKYKINLQNQLIDLSNEFVKYYIATNSENNEEFYAIIFERNFNPNLHTIFSLLNTPCDSIVSPVAVSLVKLSNNKVVQLCVIVPKYNPVNNLEQLISTEGLVSNKYAREELLPFFLKTIEYCDQRGIACGNINVSNILVTNSGLVLREPYIALPHYYQKQYYLASELLDCSESGRITGDTKADIFSLAVVIFEALHGFYSSNKSVEELKLDRLNTSSYQTIVNKIKLNDDYKNLFKGCFSDSPSDRWNLSILTTWSSGKLITIPKEGDSNDAVTPISFNNHNYLSFKALASALFNSWEVATNFVLEERFLKWVKRSIGKNRILDTIDEVISKESGLSGYMLTGQNKEVRLSKVLTIMDTYGNIKFKNFSTYFSGLPEMFFYGYTKQKKHYVDNVLKIITKNLFEDFAKLNPIYEIEFSKKNKIQELGKIYNVQLPGFGNERILYELNPNLPCLSPTVISDYIYNLPDLLVALEKLAETNSENCVFDRHLVSFIAKNISLTKEDLTKAISGLPALTEDSVIYPLSMLAVASLKHPEIKLVHLSKVLGDKSSNFIKLAIHNIYLKKTILTKITDAIAKTSLAEILKAISNQKLFINDQNGYYKACRDINLLNQRKNLLANSTKVKKFGVLLGQRVTVLLSYLLFLIVAFTLAF